MRNILTLAAVTMALPLLLTGTPAAANCSSKQTSGIFGTKFDKRSYQDCDNDSTKDLNGRVGQSAALGASMDSRIANPDERINLDLNWTTNEFGGAGAAGGAVFVGIPEIDPNLYVGFRGAHSFEGGGDLFGVGVTYAFSPF